MIIALLILLTAGTVAAAEPPEERTEPAVRLKAGDVIEYEYRQWTRERAGSGADRFHQERTVTGTATLVVLGPREKGGWHAAWYSDLKEEISWEGPEKKKPVDKTWRNVTLIELTPALRQAGEPGAAEFPSVGNAAVLKLVDEAPEEAPVVPIPIPPVSLDRVAKNAAWAEKIIPLAAFGRVEDKEAELTLETSEKNPDRVLFSRLLMGNEVTYTEAFLIDRKARRLTGADFMYHQCDGGGNTRQVTSMKEKSYRTLSDKDLEAAKEAAVALRKVASLLTSDVSRAKTLLAVLKKKTPDCVFMPAADAAQEELFRKR